MQPIEVEDEFPTVDSELAALTEEEAQTLAAEIELEELGIDTSAVELTQEQALALIAELEAEYPQYQAASQGIGDGDVVLELESPQPMIVEFEYLQQ